MGYKGTWASCLVLRGKCFNSILLSVCAHTQLCHSAHVGFRGQSKELAHSFLLVDLRLPGLASSTFTH